MTASQRGGPGDGPPDIVANGSWRGDRPTDITRIRRRVAAIAAAAIVLVAGWAGRDYVAGSWRYVVEHRSPLPPGVVCPTFPGHGLPGPGLLAAIAALGRGTASSTIALEYGCEPASDVYDPEPRGPLPSAERPK
jgi:hypothetical protein